MPRIRTIKPDAFKSDTLADVSFFARWLFAGLWTYCDDEGKGRGDPRLIAAELFALDDMVTPSSVELAVDELVRIGSVCLYKIDGHDYLHCPNWSMHQRISHPTPSRIPDCPREHQEVLCAPPEVLRSPPETLRPEGKGKGREQGGGSDSAPPLRRPSAKCKKHANDDNPPPCGQCAGARKAAEAWQPPTLSAKRVYCPEHPAQLAGRCPECVAAAVPRPRKAS